ncbi:bifunctional diguanylate cyclase/phosphodiesterase [Sulfurimonas sp. C5]|uniref:EAL domain-containing protein n=1 Tax=Sulfurimonas sp. C5 TaxID=3036947 RepID=UPI002458660F|nr:bifunctional diguanylate cyclase/phosphodiesterase [Sulfurimonas sp. C5]MDH4943735.1 bifunctional diguanylate cyclase/phosphodiesterase [Sulfurimonas sp. C5]
MGYMGKINKSIYFIALTAIAFFIVNEVSSFWFGLEKEKQAVYQKDQSVLNNLMKAQLENVRILSDLLSTNEFVLKGYEEDNPEIIKEHIGPIWNKVRNEKLTYEIHFFKPPAISFVNFSNFNSLGKNLSNVRTDIQWVTTSFQPSTHLLMCKTYAGLRATSPIFDENGKILGGLSLGKKIEWIPSVLKENSEHEAFLVYNRKATNSLMTKYYDDFIKDKEIIGDYILADHTIEISPDDIKGMDFTKKIQKVQLHGKTYYLNIYPIVDFNQRVMGYVGTLSTLEQFFKKYEIEFLKNFILILATAIIIFYLTRRRTLSVLKKINFLENLTNKIKSKKFKLLHRISLDEKNEHSLAQLQNNIISMGLELEKGYNSLQEENREKDEQLFTQLYYDTLTQLPNRNKLFEDLNNDPKSFLALLDIKNFKQINDVFGFEIGNLVLQQVTQTAQFQLNEKEYSLYRIGSDKFIIKNHKHLSKDSFTKFIQYIMQLIENNTIQTENDISISVEMYAGICFDMSDKLAKAEMALTKAKNQNKEYVIYTQDDEEKNTHTQNLNTINKIKTALENNDILVYFQRIVNPNRKLCKYEALVRLNDNGTILSPYYFIDIAQKTKYYPSITKEVLRQTFEKFRGTECIFSINISASDILNEHTKNFIKEQLHTCSNANHVIFEILESEEIYNLPEIEEFFQEIKKLGARIAIDDFGTGYSNFSYLLKINPDLIKIDGSLIKNIDTDERAQKVVKSIITFAKESNIITVAEFVHSQEVYKVCKDLGIDEFQGYLFAEPTPDIILE